MHLQARDVVLALKLVATEPHRLSQHELAETLHASVGGTHNSLRRLHACRLLLQDDAVRREALLGFLVHGVPYVFPGTVGPEASGLTTGPETPGIRERLDVTVRTRWVWPTAYPITPLRGRAITPLYAGAPRPPPTIPRSTSCSRWWTSSAPPTTRRGSRRPSSSYAPASCPRRSPCATLESHHAGASGWCRAPSALGASHGMPRRVHRRGAGETPPRTPPGDTERVPPAKPPSDTTGNCPRRRAFTHCEH